MRFAGEGIVVDLNAKTWCRLASRQTFKIHQDRIASGTQTQPLDVEASLLIAAIDSATPPKVMHDENADDAAP